MLENMTIIKPNLDSEKYLLSPGLEKELLFLVLLLHHLVPIMLCHLVLQSPRRQYEAVPTQHSRGAEPRAIACPWEYRIWATDNIIIWSRQRTDRATPYGSLGAFHAMKSCARKK